MTDAVADFRADVRSTRSDHEEFESTRVLVNDSQIVFVTEDKERSVWLSDVFDISKGIAAAADTSSQQSLTLAFRDGEIRETATLRCQGKRLANFQIVLFKLLFDELEVRMRTERGGTSLSRATLSVSKTAVQLGRDGGTTTIKHEHVAGFETDKMQFKKSDQQPVVFIFWADEHNDAKTMIVLPSFQYLNLFGRYMQLYTSRTSERRERGSIRVLLVDDDAHDLEMAELLLQEEAPDLSIEPATSATAGCEILDGDETIHCVISDYDMPGTDGIEFLQQVRAEYPDLPFILFTGQGSETVAKQALLSDVTDYVEKGIGSEQYAHLAERVESAVR